MNFNSELAALIGRDLGRLLEQLEAFPEEAALWQVVPGVTNSAGNLMLHLEGNLREYIGRRIGGIAYDRRRELEFSSQGVSRADLARRLKELQELIPPLIKEASQQRLDAEYAGTILGEGSSTTQFLLHLYGHLNWHLGQIDYLRRILTRQGALPTAGPATASPAANTR